MVGADTPSVNRYHVILGRAWQATGTCVRIGKNALRAALWTRDHNFKNDPNHSFRHYVIFKVFLLLWMCKICSKSQEDYYYYFCVITVLLGNKSCAVGMLFYYSLNGIACLGCTHEELCQCQTTINSCFELLVRQVWTIWCLISRAWTWSVNMFDWSGWDPCHRATSSWCFTRLSFSIIFEWVLVPSPHWRPGPIWGWISETGCAVGVPTRQHHKHTVSVVLSLLQICNQSLEDNISYGFVTRQPGTDCHDCPSLLVSFSVDNGCSWTLNVYRKVTFSNESRLCLLQLAHSVKCQSMERMWRTLCWFMHRYGESFWWRECDGEEQHLPQWKNKASHHW